MAQLALAVAGAAIGGELVPGVIALGITGSSAGWAIGSLIGSAFGKKQHSYGLRLSDLKVTGADYGEVIPYIIGAPRQAGILAWASERREVATTTTAGKGSGPKSTSYSYEVDALYLLSDNPLEGVTRIWLNGKLVWTTLGTASSESLSASDQTDLWSRVTFYPGSDTDLPDPTYEAAVGTNAAPGYRGRAKLFIEALQLGTSGQLPQLTFEAAATVLPGGVSLNDTMAEIQLPHAYTSFDAPYVDESGTLKFVAYDTTTVFPYDAATAYVYSVSASGDVSILGEYTVNRADLIGRGNTDAPHALIFNAGAGGHSYLYYSGYSGSSVVLTMPPGDSHSLGPAWSARGSNIYIASHQGGAPNKVYRFTAAGGLPVATSPALPYPVQYVAASSAYVYCMEAQDVGSGATNSIYVLDALTLALIEIIAGPTAPALGDGAAAVHTNGSGELFYTRGHTSPYPWHKRTSSGWVLVSADTANANTGPVYGQSPSTARKASIVKNTLYVVSYDAINFKYVIYRANATQSPATVTLSEAVRQLCVRAGMSAGQFSTAGLDSITKPVRALAVAQVGSTRPVIEQLMAGYFFTAALSDKLYFRARASAPVATIPFADLAAGRDTAAAEPFEITLDNDLELPAAVAVRFKNANNDQQAGTEYSDRVLAGQATTQTIELAQVFTPAEAKGIADAICNDNIAALVSVPLSVGLAYAEIEPGDVVQVVDGSDTTHRLRITTRSDDGAVIAFGTTRDDASVVLSAGITDNTVIATAEVTTSPETTMYPLDIPLLRAADDGPGYYVTAKGEGAIWPGGVVLTSSNGADYTTAAEIKESGVLGTVIGTLSDWSSGAVTDVASVLDVTLGRGELASTTRDELLNDGTVNVLLVGREVVRFQDATLTGTNPNTYRVSRLFRGCLGTEWAMTGHTANERVVLLQSRGIRHVTQAAADVGQPRYLKGVTVGRSPANVSAQTFTNTGVSQKPWAPVNARLTAGNNGDVTITWSRRTRFGATFCGPSGISAPLSETLERYDIEFYNSDAFDNLSLKATYSDIAQASYTHAFSNQFWINGNAAPARIYAIVYQKAGSLRGYGLRISLAVPYTAGATLNPALVSASASGYVIQTRRTGDDGVTRMSYWLSATPGGTYTETQIVAAGAFTPNFTQSAGHRAQNSTLAINIVPSSLLNFAGDRSQTVFTVAPLDLASAPVAALPSPYMTTPRAVVGDGSRFLLFGESNHVFSSTDGLAWSDLGAMSGATFPNLIGSDDYLGQAVKKVGSRFFLIFGRLADSGTLNTVFYSDHADARTGWTAASGIAVDTATYVLPEIVSDGTYLYAVKSSSITVSWSIMRSADNGATWTLEASDSGSAFALQCTGTTGSDKVRVYTQGGITFEKDVGTTTWSAGASSGLANPFHYIAHNGTLIAQDNAPLFTSGGAVIKHETGGAFATVAGF